MATFLLSACKRSGYAGSGLPDTLVGEPLVKQVGASQGVRILERTGGGGTHRGTCEAHWQYSITFSNGTAGQFSNHLPEFRKFASQFSILGAQNSFLFFHLPVQSLDGRQRHSVGVDRSDVFVIPSQTERCTEVLRHRAKMTDAVPLRSVRPRGQRQSRQLGQHGVAIHRQDVLLQVAVGVVKGSA